MKRSKSKLFFLFEYNCIKKQNQCNCSYLYQDIFGLLIDQPVLHLAGHKKKTLMVISQAHLTNYLSTLHNTYNVFIYFKHKKYVYLDDH